MWLTIGGGVLATLSAFPGPSAPPPDLGRHLDRERVRPCVGVITLPGPYPSLLDAWRADDGHGANLLRLVAERGRSPVRVLLTLPHEACPWPPWSASTPSGWPVQEPPSGDTGPTRPSLDPVPRPSPLVQRTQESAKKPRSRGEIAASAAVGRIGTPFSWGGGASSGPTRGIGRGAGTVGFDCSGLTLYAWSKAGVKLGHYTGTQFRQGRRVPQGELRKGDLVFFGGGAGDPTHVGLYLGRGVMVHAPKTGDVVRKTDFLGSGYYRAGYRGAVRPG